MARNSEVGRLADLARGQGWRVEWTKNNHIKFVPPKGRIVYTGSTPSDHRAVKNLAHDLRRLGLVLA